MDLVLQHTHTNTQLMRLSSYFFSWSVAAVAGFTNVPVQLVLFNIGCNWCGRLPDISKKRNVFFLDDTFTFLALFVDADAFVYGGDTLIKTCKKIIDD